jgi:predicted aspartyl protease
VPDYRDDPLGNPDNPPGPYLPLIVRWGGAWREILALVDTGADGTQIPNPTAEGLELEQIDTIWTRDAHNRTRESPVYYAHLEFAGFEFPAVLVVGEDYPIALIGRDVLNELITTLNGPARAFEFARPIPLDRPDRW